jgi:DNA-binding NarL/FixJ family response regulator
MGSAKKRALTRLGLELSGEFDVVGVATETRDVEATVASGRPDVVLIDFTDTDVGDLAAVPLVRRACPSAKPVLYEALTARHIAAGSTHRSPRPIELARLLERVLSDAARPDTNVVIRGARRAGDLVARAV